MKRFLVVFLGCLFLSASGCGLAYAEPRSVRSDDVQRSIARTGRAVSTAGHAVAAHRDVPGHVEALRKVVVQHTAAVLAEKKGRERTAMHLTLAARRAARDLLARLDRPTDAISEDESETVAAQGGAGNAADEALAEAETKVPPLEQFKDKVPYEITEHLAD